MTQKVTFCRICEPLCGMVATVEDGKITKLRPDPANPLSEGCACPKGIAMAEVQNDPDRVLHPLRRTASGEFERVGWQEALDDIARRLRRILDERGPESVAWYMGNPGAFSYSHTLWVKGFLDALGSPHYYTAGSQDVNNRFAASALLYGSPLLVPIPDLPRTSFLLMVGANPLVSHGSVLSAPRVREKLLEIEGEAALIRLADMLAHYTAGQAVEPARMLKVARTLGLNADQLRSVMYELPYGGDGQRRNIDPCPLSAREVEVLRRLAEGKVYKQIALELNLSTSTVRTHLHNTYTKLGAVDRAQAVLLATERGWI